VPVDRRRSQIEPPQGAAMAFGAGFIGGGVGTGFGLVVGSIAVSAGVSTLVAGAVGGAVNGLVGNGVTNVLSNGPESFGNNALAATGVGALLGGVVPRMMPQRGFEATQRWWRGIPLSGGYVGPNTFTRYRQEAVQDAGQAIAGFAAGVNGWKCSFNTTATSYEVIR
jgi:hypothetical protein